MERLAKLETGHAQHVVTLTDHEKRIRWVERAITAAGGAVILAELIVKLKG